MIIRGPLQQKHASPVVLLITRLFNGGGLSTATSIILNISTRLFKMNQEKQLYLIFRSLIN